VIGPVEALVLKAWGHGIRIDAGDAGNPEGHSATLLAILDEARKLDNPGNRNGCLGCPMVNGECPHCGNCDGPP
jgi:hypothetical protein